MPADEIQVTIKGADELEALFKDFPALWKNAQYSALVKTGTTGRVNIVKRLGGVMTLQSKYINRAFDVIKPPSYDKLEERIRISHQAIPTIGFNPMASGQGVFVAFYGGKAPYLFSHQFMVTLKSGHKGVYERIVGRASGGPLTTHGFPRRLPIKEGYGPTVLGAFEGVPAMVQEETDKLGDLYVKNLGSQYDRFIGSGKKAPAEGS